MSVTDKRKRITPTRIQAMKGGTPIVCLTAYTTPIARLLDEYCDLLLVGDSLGMVLYGMDSTIPVTLDMMIAPGSRRWRLPFRRPFRSGNREDQSRRRGNWPFRRLWCSR